VIQYESDGVTVLEPTQDLHAGDECDQIEGALARLAEGGAQVVIDVSHVQHISAHCLGILAHAHQVASQHGGCIVLCGPSRMEHWLLAKTGLAGVISVHDDVASAKRRLATLPRAVA
jgi:anti-anti-sigma factor